jgi:hypothetical protein
MVLLPALISLLASSPVVGSSRARRLVLLAASLLAAGLGLAGWFDPGSTAVPSWTIGLAGTPHTSHAVALDRLSLLALLLGGLRGVHLALGSVPDRSTSLALAAFLGLAVVPQMLVAVAATQWLGVIVAVSGQGSEPRRRMNVRRPAWAAAAGAGAAAAVAFWVGRDLEVHTAGWPEVSAAALVWMTGGALVTALRTVRDTRRGAPGPDQSGTAGRDLLVMSAAFWAARLQSFVTGPVTPVLVAVGAACWLLWGWQPIALFDTWRRGRSVRRARARLRQLRDWGLTWFWQAVMPVLRRSGSSVDRVVGDARQWYGLAVPGAVLLAVTYLLWR